ncbi:hypothetical protein RUND412_010172 [Rhizina undulata]
MSHHSVAESSGTSPDSTSRPQVEVWHPDPLLSSESRAEVVAVVDAMASKHKEPPAKGGLYASPEDAYNRLQDWAFCKGFCVVKRDTSASRWRFECIHHGKDTRNIRKLTKETRQRKTVKSHAKDCSWGMYIAYNIVKPTELLPDGKKRRAWFLGVTNASHNHPMAPNPLVYDEHRKRHPDRLRAIAQAVQDRRANLSYRDFVRRNQLDNSILGWPRHQLTAKEFYNSNARNKRDFSETGDGDTAKTKKRKKTENQ